MSNWTKIFAVGIATLIILMSFKIAVDANQIEDAKTKVKINTYDLVMKRVVLDTIPEPNPDESEYSREKHEQEDSSS